ncbi:hypothetical protein GCK72_013267 [Caenorhabditis remanei]|uniref:DUF38 domain-containing protein n=1 Tax=Caenorhabditis remanei TaxID=31234 RepID=A0A6A5GQD8_CAERE|nr:hypothetical protein GCK72_013267 [Caenorhabditis remanei]KAF1756813.1 hypothetical protein GCK72_013267 [Caenorhabditis remanei]
MEANKRFALVSRVKSLRILHQRIPLHIETLKFFRNGFQLNNIEHSFVVKVRASKNKELTPFQKSINDRHGVPFDLDRYGNEEPRTHQFPGDIKFGEKTTFEPEVPPKEARKCFPYTCIVFKVNEKKWIKPMTRKIPLRQALRERLHCVLNKGTVYVKDLWFDMGQEMLRIPERLKFKTKRLHVKELSQAVCNAFSMVLRPSSFPLKEFEFQTNFSEDEVFANNDIVHVTKSLTIKLPSGYEAVSVLRLVKSLEIKRLHLASVMVLEDVLLPLIRDWIETPRNIGCTITMVSRIRTCYRVVSLANKELKEKQITTREWNNNHHNCLSIKKNNCEFNIFRVPISNDMKELPYDDESINGSSLCLVKMVMEAEGTAEKTMSSTTDGTSSV